MKFYLQLIGVLCCLSCMKSPSLSMVKIANGVEIKDSVLPFVVPVYSYLNNRIVCTGALLNSSQILTAAHCVDRTAGGLAFASQLGRVVRRGNGNYDKRYLSSRIKAVKDMAGDFAVLEFGENILPHLLPEEYPSISNKPPEAGEGIILVGYGAKSKYEGKRKAGKKLMAYNQVLSVSEEFIEVRGEAWPQKNIPLGQDGSILHGDSGGPLISSENHKLILGVASYYFPVYGKGSKLDSYFTNLTSINW